jgi:hypothetical protein
VRFSQAERSGPSGLTAYVAVVEFGAPRGKVERTAKQKNDLMPIFRFFPPIFPR